MTFDPNKPSVTRGNKYPARIICTDKKSIKGTGYPSPIVALVDFGDEEVVVTCGKNGFHRWAEVEDDLDLINIEEKLPLPITPGRYRMRDGEIAVIQGTDGVCLDYPVTGTIKGQEANSYGTVYWQKNGKFFNDKSNSYYDLIERLPDAPKSISLESLNTKLDELLRRIG